MEPRENVNHAGGSPRDKLALAAAMCAVTGIGLFGASCGLTVAIESASSGSAILEQVVMPGYWISILLWYFLAPVLATIASSIVLVDCARIKRHKSGEIEAMYGGRTAGRLLVTGVLLALPPALPAMWAIFHGYHFQLADRGGLTPWLLLMAVVAAVTGYASGKLYGQRAGGRLRRLGVLSTMLAVPLIVIALTPIPDYLARYGRGSVHARGAEPFSGTSEALTGTTVVATLDCPVPEYQNVVWCSSFQLAWNALRDNVVGEPVEVVGGEGLVKRLNAGGPSVADLEAELVYAAAGRIEEGIVDRIKRNMSRRFPSVTLPDFSDCRGIPRAIVAYSYLVAQVPFTYPYRRVEGAFTFTDSNGVATDVEAFGLWEAFMSRYEKVREQMDILFVRSSDPNDQGLRPDEYAIDLCKHSEPHQVVVARVDLKGSLGETLDYIRLRMSEFERIEYYDDARQFRKSDVLKVPEMFWEIEHRFRELIGKDVANADVNMPIVEAMQAIQFRLNRSGAAVEGESLVAVEAIPRHFEFNRPFLVYMMKRGANRPFFVMWVDNAELLVAR